MTMREKYILTDIEAKDVLKEALGKRYSLYRRVSAVYRAGATDSKDFKQISDSVLQDIANVIGQPRTRQENDVPFTEEYPELVYDEIVRKAGPVEFRVDESFRDGEYVRILNFTLRNKVWSIAYRYRKLYSLEWDGEGVHNHVWNILSYGWSNYNKGNWTECMNPATAAELFLMMDDMAGYLDDEIFRTFCKVRKNQMCRQIRQITADALADSPDGTGHP